MKISKVTGANRFLRILVYGKHSVGKTHFALTGPGEVLAFDVEGRINSMADKQEIPPFSQVDFDERKIVAELVDASTEVRSGTTPFKTFVLDSYTDVEIAIARLKGWDTKLAQQDRRDPTKNFELADRRLFLETQVLNATLTGPTKAHFVWTAHEKNQWIGKETVGKDPDGTRNLMHYFDLAFHMQIDPQTKKRVALVVKSNYQSYFKVGDVVTDLNWSMLAPIIEGKIKTDEISSDKIKEAYRAAGAPDGNIGVWFETAGFKKVEGAWKLTPEEKLRALGLLTTMIDEKGRGAAA
jgi:hypothetical protein